MGQILFFEPQRIARRRAATTDRGSPSTAAIIIFPGVRYERLGEVAPRAKADARVSDRPRPRPSRH
jgi:hypothetical protein